MLTRAFGRDQHTFRLRVAEWREVEKTCAAGLAEIGARLSPIVQLVGLIDGDPANYPGGLLAAIADGRFGRARIDDVREPILQGLVGGGLTSTEAGALVRLVFDEEIAACRAPFVVFSELAFSIIGQALVGLADELPGEQAATTAQKKSRRRSRMAKPASSKSMPPAP
jgi:hypothetical protein